MRTFLETMLGPADRLLGSLPLGVGRWLVVAFLIAAALATLLLPKWYVYLGAPDRRLIRDLRWWTVAITIPYVLIYAWL